jgi:hypothetical protein
MTNSSEKPQVPNYVPDVGRLVTDRFDFRKHINGIAFNHNASGINLSPIITINGDGYNNVQSALAALAQNIIPPTISNATTSSLGLIQLSGDISGAATTVRVTGLRGFPIQNLTPTINQVLTYNGTAWIPATPVAAPSGWSAPIAATVRIISANYTVDSSGSDLFLFVSPSAPINITLPAPTLGRVLIIKAISAIGNSGNTITILSHGSEIIDGDTTSYAYTVNYGTLRLISDSVNWWIW